MIVTPHLAQIEDLKIYKKSSLKSMFISDKYSKI